MDMFLLIEEVALDRGGKEFRFGDNRQAQNTEEGKGIPLYKHRKAIVYYKEIGSEIWYRTLLILDTPGLR